MFLVLIDKKNIKYIFPLILPISIIFFICVLLSHNYSKYGALMGPDHYMHSLSGTVGGFLGASLNLIRYFFNVIDLPAALGGNIFTYFHDLVLGNYKTTGVMWPEYYVVNLSGSLNPVDVSAWYGLLGLPILISIGFTAFKGKGFLRIIALSVAISAIVIGIKIPWSPYFGRYLALTFAGGLVCFAFMLQYSSKKYPRVSKYMVRCALFVSIFNLTYFSFYTNLKDFSELKFQLNNRDFYYSELYKNGFLDIYKEKIPSGTKVLLFTGYDTPIFPLFLRRPDLNITVTGVPDYSAVLGIDSGHHYQEKLKLNGKNFDLSEPADFKEVQKLFDIIIPLRVPQKYQSYHN